MLKELNSFDIIPGSSAGALFGLQFFIITLISEKPFSGLDRTALVQAAAALNLVSHHE